MFCKYGYVELPLTIAFVEHELFLQTYKLLTSVLNGLTCEKGVTILSRYIKYICVIQHAKRSNVDYELIAFWKRNFTLET